MGVPNRKEYTRTQYFETGSDDDPIRLCEGASLPQVRVAYETWGTLNHDKSNAILLFHALSGSQHAAGHNPDGPDDCAIWQPDIHEGWWDAFIGPGKGLDTNRYFIICPNYLGGCYGTTGPSSLSPDTKRPYGAAFPHVSISDQVHLMVRLLDHLGVDTLHATIGPSVGGLCALTLAGLFPDRVRNIISVASGLKTTVLNRLILF